MSTKNLNAFLRRYSGFDNEFTSAMNIENHLYKDS